MDKRMLKATANWLAQVGYDVATAEQMLYAGRYIYVIFMSHMALEKALKALLTEGTQKLPLRTHNLIDLAQRAQVVLSQEQQDFLGKLNNASVIVRYPDDLAAMVTQYPEAIAQDYLEKTKELILWIGQAERDWKVARCEMQTPDPVWNVGCFLAEQCTEKYLQGFLEEQNIDTHCYHFLTYPLSVKVTRCATKHHCTYTSANSATPV